MPPMSPKKTPLKRTSASVPSKVRSPIRLPFSVIRPIASGPAATAMSFITSRLPRPPIRTPAATPATAAAPKVRRSWTLGRRIGRILDPVWPL